MALSTPASTPLIAPGAGNHQSAATTAIHLDDEMTIKESSATPVSPAPFDHPGLLNRSVVSTRSPSSTI